MEKQPTIYSIASALGIHPSTVSRAFTRPDMVRPEMRERIRKTADELHYTPNAVARGLITGKTGMVGLLIPDIKNPFFPPAIHAIQSALSAHELEIILINSDLADTAEVALIDRVRSQLDGLVLVSPRSDPETLVRAARGLPLTLVNREVEGAYSVIIESETAVIEAGDHLKSLGHEIFALLRGPKASWSAQRRQTAVQGWAEREGVDLIELGPYEAVFEGGLEAASNLCSTPATAVLAFDDVMAAGVVAGLSKEGVAVPQDLSIVGCDDVLLATVIAPSLSTVAAPFEELGSSVSAGLRAQMSGGEAPKPISLPGTFVIRESTGPAPSQRSASKSRARGS